MNQAGMIRIYETEKGWAKDKADNLWTSWHSQGREVLADEHDHHPMMWVLTEIYADQGKYVDSADVVQAGQEDQKSLQRSIVQQHTEDLQDGGVGLFGNSLENVEKRLGAVYSPITADDNAGGGDFSSLLQKALNMQHSLQY